MDAVRVGDSLFDENGHICRVTFATDVQYQRRCYRVAFDDGSSIVVDAEHRWLAWDKPARQAAGRALKPQSHPRIVATEEMSQSVGVGPRGDRNWSIVLSRPLNVPEAALPVDPYVLGVWLGDGDSKSATLTVGEHDAHETLASLASVGCETRLARVDPSGAHRYAMGSRPSARDPLTGRMVANDSLHSSLRALGVLRNKHVPAAYLRASEPQRLALLQGLMDTDGSIAPRGHVEFCSTTRNLAEAVYELAVSLGEKPAMSEGDAVLAGRVCGRRWRVRWTATRLVFRLARKRARLRTGTRQQNRTRHRYIVAVESVDSVPVRCLTVDSPSHLFLAGRQMVPTHNTRTGAEFIRAEIESGRASRAALVAPTAADARDVMVEGESGLLAIGSPKMRPTYEPSKRRVVWPNGAQATLYSADEPDRLRGPQHDVAWGDEIAAWRYPEAYDQLMFGLRLGMHPRGVFTTTPRPTQLVRNLITDSSCVVTRGTTYENRANLAPTFFTQVVARYEGTRLGRQELYAEVLEDVEGALLTRALFDRYRRSRAQVPALVRIGVAIDPAVTSGETADETGIVGGGIDAAREGYVTDDESGRYTPYEWGRRAVDLYHRIGADIMLAEVNNGGDMVKAIIRSIDPTVNFRAVHASRGKHIRAEPIAALYEQGKVHHVGGFATLEDQLCAFTTEGYVGAGSPDRADAAVWLLSDLMLRGAAVVDVKRADYRTAHR